MVPGLCCFGELAQRDGLARRAFYHLYMLHPNTRGAQLQRRSGRVAGRSPRADASTQMTQQASQSSGVGRGKPKRPNPVVGASPAPALAAETPAGGASTVDNTKNFQGISQTAGCTSWPHSRTPKDWTGWLAVAPINGWILGFQRVRYRRSKGLSS